MSSPNQIQNTTAAHPMSLNEGQQNQAGGGYTPYPSNHPVVRGRYITSNDSRGYLPVWEYPLNNQWIMMDSDDGYVLWTSICKALSKTKADITKMVESDPELPARIRRVKGGFLKVQGTWIPHDSAIALARKIAWPIKEDLVPIFGPDFPSTCLSPDDPAFGDILNPRGRARRNTQPAMVPSSSRAQNSGGGSSQGQGQGWMSSAPVPIRRGTDPNMGVPPSSYGSSPPRTIRQTAQSHLTSPSHYAASTRNYGQPPYQPQVASSQTPSPTHTMQEETVTTPTYQPYSHAYTPSYGGGHQAASPPVYSQPPASMYHQPSASYHGYPTHHATQHQGQMQAQAQQASPQQEYLPHPATPTHSTYPGTAESGTYASHGVSESPRQPCDTYQQQSHEQSYSGGYASHQYPAHAAESYQPYQPTSAPVASSGSSYALYSTESNVRHSGDGGGYGVAPNSHGGGQDYRYSYPQPSAGTSNGSPQRTYQPQSAAQYHDYQASQANLQAQQQQQQYAQSYNYQQSTYQTQGQPPYGA